MKKWLIAVLLVVLLGLVACSNASDQSAAQNGNGDSDTTGDVEATGGDGKITIWAWDVNFNIKALEIAQEHYQSINPNIEFEVIENAQDDIVQRLNTSLSSGTTRGLPNIVLIEDYRAQSFLNAYPDSFHPITGSFNAEDFAPYKLAPTSYDGENYGLPFDTGVTGLFVRTDYLEDAGYTADDLSNIDWYEYIEIGKDVYEATGKKMITTDPSDLGLIRTMIQSAGSWYMEDDGITPNLANNEALKAAFTVYKDMVEEDIMGFHSDWSQFLQGFNSGDVASVQTGNWISPSIKAEESQAGLWQVVEQPRLSGVDGAVNASNLGGSSWYVLDVDGKEDAVEFLVQTFGSNIDFYQDLVTEIGAIGTYMPAAEGEAYQYGDDYFQGQSIIATFSEWAELIPQINYGMHTYAIDDILVVEMQNYLNGKDLDEALADAQAQAEASLN
ncbi:ABC transporter substrate-binding protein [Bacillus sp. JCM 19034]|uniref:ABC transporter substrate-binding protein n=1 Tax=Bacillus sp. JCM 19034 TaxID=1481928 RepID=UPI000785BADE|nr:extracellular solute-binding protein [Bacillus sp. JCM 19034]